MVKGWVGSTEGRAAHGGQTVVRSSPPAAVRLRRRQIVLQMILLLFPPPLHLPPPPDCAVRGTAQWEKRNLAGKKDWGRREREAKPCAAAGISVALNAPLQKLGCSLGGFSERVPHQRGEEGGK